jgi:hypothetical protein
MSSSEEDLDDNVFTQQRSLFKSGLDAFMVALHRWGVDANCSLEAHCCGDLDVLKCGPVHVIATLCSMRLATVIKH